MWSVWLIFCDCGFPSVYPLMEKDKKLRKASWWERLWGKLGIVLMGSAMLSKSSNFLLMSGVVPPPCCLAWGQTADPRETPRHSQACLTQSLVRTLLLSPGSWCTQGLVCALQESVSPALWKFCSQIPLASRVKFPGSSQSLCWIPRLGNLLWVLQLS